MKNVTLEPEQIETIEKLLRGNPDSIVGLVLRLAWLEGLTRDEINNLTWEQVDHERQELQLTDRSVPMEGDMLPFLRQWQMLYGEYGPFVAVSEHRHMRMTPESISNMVRIALNGAGLKGVGLRTLRYNYVLRQLQEHDWPYVVRVAGMSVTTYRLGFGEGKRTEAQQRTAPLDRAEQEQKLDAVLQGDRTSPAGIALWLCCRCGLFSEEIVGLTWEQVDFEKAVLRLEGREVPMSEEVCRILAEEQKKRAETEDAHVILTPRTRKPLTTARLSTMVRTLLIRGGIEDQSLRFLRHGHAQEEEKSRVLAFVTQHGGISRGECAELLGVTDGMAYRRLNELAFNGNLVRIGNRYFPADSAVTPEQQRGAIRAFLAETESVGCDEIAELLHIGKRPAARLLKRMAEEGALAELRSEKRYRLAAKKQQQNTLYNI